MFATTDLLPLLAERGVALSREQAYRLVVRVPERLNLTALATLCDILDCSPPSWSSPTPRPPPPRAVARWARRRPGRASTGRAATGQVSCR